MKLVSYYTSGLVLSTKILNFVKGLFQKVLHDLLIRYTYPKYVYYFIGNTMIIPAKYMKDGARYEIKMRVRDSIDHLWQEATQVVVSYKDAVALQIGYISIMHIRTVLTQITLSCLKNCLPVSFRTNSRVPTVLRAYCIENCAQVGKNSYVWKLEQTSDTPSTDSPAGNTTTAGPTEASGYANEEAANTTEFYYVKPNTISNGGSVKITLTLAGLWLKT